MIERSWSGSWRGISRDMTRTQGIVFKPWPLVDCWQRHLRRSATPTFRTAWLSWDRHLPIHRPNDVPNPPSASRANLAVRGLGSGSCGRTRGEDLGEVSVALDEELQREVALKELQTRYADDPVSRSRFVLEAEITGKLEHPGIVPVYGMGRYPDGRPYYAMRFVKGDTLKHAIARYHEPNQDRRPDPGSRALAFPRPPTTVPGCLSRDRICPQQRRAAPGYQAKQCHGWEVRGDPRCGLGLGQSSGASRQRTGP